MSNKRHLYSVYQRIKKNCCEQWQGDSNSFYTWYENQAKKQKGLCEYCHLPGDTGKYYKRYFREGRRGISLEVDRKDGKKEYSPENCVLACYPCNNAKSDVFSYEEFAEIGNIISKVKKQATRKSEGGNL